MNRPAVILGALALLGFSCASSPGRAVPGDQVVEATPAPRVWVSPVWRIPEDFRIVGYFPGWSGDPAEVSYSALTHLNYAFVLVDSTGAFLPVDAPEKLDSLVSKAHAAGRRVLASVGGWNSGSTKAFDTIAADPARIQRLVEGALVFLEAYHLDGIDLDWEYPRASTASGYASVVKALGEALHLRGWELSLAVGANDLNGRAVLDEAWQTADWVNVMAYDDGWAGPPGTAHSSYSFAKAAVDYWVGTRGLPGSKVVLGVPFYGRHLVTWKARSVHSLLGEYPEALTSGQAGDFAFNGTDTLRSKVVNQARRRAGGVMVWQLNQDAPGPSSLLGLIYDTVKEPVE